MTVVAEKQVERTDRAEWVWLKIDYELEVDVAPARDYQWLRLLRCEGEAQGALCISAPAENLAWVESQYARKIGSLAREHGFRGVFLSDREGECFRGVFLSDREGECFRGVFPSDREGE